MNQIIEPHQFIKVGLRNNKVVSIDWKELEYYDIPREELFNIVRKFLNDAIFMLDSVSDGRVPEVNDIPSSL